MKSEFEIAITQLCSDRNLSPDVILEAIEAALVSAYKRNFGSAANQNVVVRLNRQSGDVRVFVQRQVVEEVADPRVEVSLEEARAANPNAKLGGVVEEEVTPQNFGRIAAGAASEGSFRIARAIVPVYSG